MKIDRKNQGDVDTVPKSNPEKEVIMGLKREINQEVTLYYNKTVPI